MVTISGKNRELFTTTNGDEALLCCCIVDSELEDLLALGTSAGIIHLVPLSNATDREKCSIDLDLGPVLDISTCSGSPMVFACVDNKVAFTCVESGAVCSLVVDEQMHVEVLRVLPSGEQALVGGCTDEDGQLVCIGLDPEQLEEAAYCSDEEGAEVLWKLQFAQSVLALALHPSLDQAAVGHGNACTLLDSNSGEVLLELSVEGLVYALAFAPAAGKSWLAVAGADECVGIFDCDTGTRRTTLALGHAVKPCCMNTSCILAVAFWDGDTVFSGGYDKAVTMWKLDPVETSELL